MKIILKRKIVFTVIEIGFFKETANLFQVTFLKNLFFKFKKKLTKKSSEFSLTFALFLADLQFSGFYEFSSEYPLRDLNGTT